MLYDLKLGPKITVFIFYNTFWVDQTAADLHNLKVTCRLLVLAKCQMKPVKIDELKMKFVPSVRPSTHLWKITNSRGDRNVCLTLYSETFHSKRECYKYVMLYKHNNVNIFSIYTGTTRNCTETNPIKVYEKQTKNLVETVQTEY